MYFTQISALNTIQNNLKFRRGSLYFQPLSYFLQKVCCTFSHYRIFSRKCIVLLATFLFSLESLLYFQPLSYFLQKVHCTFSYFRIFSRKCIVLLVTFVFSLESSLYFQLFSYFLQKVHCTFSHFRIFSRKFVVLLATFVFSLESSLYLQPLLYFLKSSFNKTWLQKQQANSVHKSTFVCSFVIISSCRSACPSAPLKQDVILLLLNS